MLAVRPRSIWTETEDKYSVTPFFPIESYKIVLKSLCVQIILIMSGVPVHDTKFCSVKLLAFVNKKRKNHETPVGFDFVLFASHSSPSCDSSVVPVSSVWRPSSPQDAKVEVVSSQRQDEAPEEEVPPREEPGDSLLEQADYLTGHQDLGCPQAQTPEALNGGSEHSPSLKGV